MFVKLALKNFLLKKAFMCTTEFIAERSHFHANFALELSVKTVICTHMLGELTTPQESLSLVLSVKRRPLQQGVLKFIK